MRILTTRKYAKRREMTCGYAKGVDGINRPEAAISPCFAMCPMDCRSTTHCREDDNRVQSVGADGRPLDSPAYPTRGFVIKPSVVE